MPLSLAIHAISINTYDSIHYVNVFVVILKTHGIPVLFDLLVFVYVFLHSIIFFRREWKYEENRQKLYIFFLISSKYH